MKAFWWFKKNLIAGMARPGFNSYSWFDLDFDEATLMSWLGQHSSGILHLNLLHEHINEYVPKMLKFYGADTRKNFENILSQFSTKDKILKTFEKLNKRTGLFKKYDVDLKNKTISLLLDKKRQEKDIEYLKINKISMVVCLTENQQEKDLYPNYFETYHIPIIDLQAPTEDQVKELGELINYSQKKNNKIVVHCLAGIGRTSTMLLASHLLLGENFQELKERIAKVNPSYKLTGPQADFLKKFMKE